MTVIVSWNIQNGKGVDGKISLERIASVIRAMADPDVICLQEISRNLALDDSARKPDQIAELRALFPGYAVSFGAAVETGDALGNWQFGNATLSRLPVLSVFRHALPQPAQPGIRHMPRIAIESNLTTPTGPLRIVNTHLEYHSAAQRLAQIGRIVEIDREVLANREQPPAFPAAGPYVDVGRAAPTVTCGDFNMQPYSDEYRKMLAPAPGHPGLRDAWAVLHPDAPHDPTCGVHDHVQWTEGAHCRDFFFVTEHLAGSVRRISVDI